jgi:outer membrane immunogenic protein
MRKIQTRKPVGAVLVAGILAAGPVLSSGVATAAPRKPVIAGYVTPPYDWSGWHLGAYVGEGWNGNAQQWTNADDGNLGSLTVSGVVSLFTASYAWQFGNAVVAVEGWRRPDQRHGQL